MLGATGLATTCPGVVLGAPGGRGRAQHSDEEELGSGRGWHQHSWVTWGRVFTSRGILLLPTPLSREPAQREVPGDSWREVLLPWASVPAPPLGHSVREPSPESVWAGEMGGGGGLCPVRQLRGD